MQRQYMLQIGLLTAVLLSFSLLATFLVLKHQSTKYRVKQNGIFLFVRSFFIPEIFKFSYYANLVTDDVNGSETQN